MQSVETDTQLSFKSAPQWVTQTEATSIFKYKLWFTVYLKAQKREFSNFTLTNVCLWYCMCKNKHELSVLWLQLDKV